MTASKTLRCPPMGLSPWQLVGACTGGGRSVADWPQFSGRKFCFTQSGRAAIYSVREALGLSRDDEVLLSAYNCGSEVDALRASGLEVTFIDSDENGLMRIDDLRQSVTSKTRLIYVIHPFGWPQPLDEIDAWRKKKGILLVEDCALSLLSCYPDGTPLGRKGEAAIFSFPKSLPVPDCGAITWATDWPGPTSLPTANFIRTSRQCASLLKNWVRRQQPLSDQTGKEFDLMQVERGDVIEDMPADYYFAEWRQQSTCSGITRRLLSKVDTAAVRTTRRGNFRLLLENVQERGGQVLFQELPDGVCPLSFPVIVDNRDRVAAALGRCGIYTTPWWSGGHKDVDWRCYPNATQLKLKLLPLPVHHQLDALDMDYIARTINGAFSG